MSGHEDFGPLLDALITCVGLSDVISLIGYMYYRARDDVKYMTMDGNNNDVRLSDKSKSPANINTISRHPIVPSVVVDGAMPSSDIIESLIDKVNELETKVQDLEVRSRENSMERFIEIERSRRSRSRSPSPYPLNSDLKDVNNNNDDDTETDRNTTSSSSTASFVRLSISPSKEIQRDDEFRKAIRKSPQRDAHESREEELKELSRIEKEELENMDDFVPIKYEGEDAHYPHGMSPIQEVTHSLHNESDETEHSPEPGMPSMINKPWCDIKKDVAEIRKHEKRDQIRRSLSIEEHPFAEEQEARDEMIDSQIVIVDMNESFIKMEQANVQHTKESTIVEEIKDNKILEAKSELNAPKLDSTVDEKLKLQNEISTIDENKDNKIAVADVGESFIKIEKNALEQSIEISEKSASQDGAVAQQLDQNEKAFERIEVSSTEVNEMLIKKDENIVQRSAELPQQKVLVKQAQVTSEDQPEETVSELTPNTEDFREPSVEPISVANSLMNINVDNITTASSKAPGAVNNFNNTGNIKGQNPLLVTPALGRKLMEPSTSENKRAIPSVTPDPEVSTNDPQIIVTSTDHDEEPNKINRSPSPGEGLKRTKRCINSMDRSVSRSSSRLSQSKKSKSPSVASEKDYKDWFDKFDNNTTPDLMIPKDDDDEEFDSDMEEEFLLHVDDGNLNGAEICKIDDDESIDDDTNISVSVTLNLKQSSSASLPACNPCAEFQERNTYKTKAEEFLEMERFRENKNRRISIIPSTEEDQKNFISMLHPEFPPESETSQKESHTHHEHLHNIGYNEWIKKFVDHQSCHLATSDSDSDSDSQLPDDPQMLPLFQGDQWQRVSYKGRKKR